MRRLLLLACLLTAYTTAHAAGDAAKGRAIALDAQKRGEGFVDFSAEAEMRIKNGKGAEAVRKLRIQSLDLPGAASKALTRVESPKDVAGTTLITHTGKDSSDQQWLYLPAAQRVKRIAASGRGGAFMGSEFTFDDFAAQNPDKYQFGWLRQEACPTLPKETCDVLERTPLEASAGYQKQIIWLDQSHRRLHKVDYLDASGTAFKTLTCKDFQVYNQKFWRANTLLMRNNRTQAETEMRWQNIRFSSGLKESSFDPEGLAE